MIRRTFRAQGSELGLRAAAVTLITASLQLCESELDSEGCVHSQMEMTSTRMLNVWMTGFAAVERACTICAGFKRDQALKGGVLHRPLVYGGAKPAMA